MLLSCTSGSAAANYFPALVEASEGMVPLFVALTGGLSTRAKLRLAIEGPFIAGIILVFFAVFGVQLLT